MAETNYIHANAHFAFRSDTLENWGNANPVLLAGEFGVATNGSEVQKVKIGDGLTPWKSLPWWRGPKGEKGETGEKGEKGEDYAITTEDKQDIANLVLEILPVSEEGEF